MCFGTLEEGTMVPKEAAELPGGRRRVLFYFLTVNAALKLSLQISPGHFQTPNDCYSGEPAPWPWYLASAVPN